MKKNFIKILDNVNTGLMTFNKIIHANRNFTGANFNAFIPDKISTKKEIGNIDIKNMKLNLVNKIKNILDLNAIKNDNIMKKKVEEIANKVNAEIIRPNKINKESINLNKNQDIKKIFEEENKIKKEKRNKFN